MQSRHVLRRSVIERASLRAENQYVRLFWGILIGAMLAPGYAGAQESEPAVPAARAGVVRGRVVAAADGRPLARALVTLQSESTSARALTDEQGAFEIEAPPGRYGLRASLAGYLTSAFGQSSPTDPPRAINLRAGRVRSGLEIAMPLGSVIEVRVTDESGVPVEGVYVRAQQPQVSANGERALPLDIADKQGDYGTDDHGVVRLYDLEPGEYYVLATTGTLSGRPGRTRSRPTTEPVNTFYPGVPDIADAQPVPLGLGEEIRVDLTIGKPFAALQREPAGAITVHVTDEAGNPAANADVRALEITGDDGHRTVSRARSTANNVSRGWEKKEFFTDDRGNVRIYGLPEGEYLLVVAEPGPVYFPGVMSRADAHAITIRPWDDLNLEIALTQPRGSQISGRVLRWDGEPGRTFVTLERNRKGPLYQSGFIDDTIDRVQLVDGAFTFNNVLPGDYIIRTSSESDSDLHDGFAEIAVTLDTEDLSDLLLLTTRHR